MSTKRTNEKKDADSLHAQMHFGDWEVLWTTGEPNLKSIKEEDSPYLKQSNDETMDPPKPIIKEEKLTPSKRIKDENKDSPSPEKPKKRATSAEKSALLNAVQAPSGNSSSDDEDAPRGFLCVKKLCLRNQRRN